VNSICTFTVQKLDGAHHLALVKGKISKTRPTLVRVHSECLTAMSSDHAA
jgi:GTP cyclohydrolase II